MTSVLPPGSRRSCNSAMLRRLVGRRAYGCAFTLCAWALWGLVASGPVAHAETGTWVPGLVHVHTPFSDGTLTPALLAKALQLAGIRFVIVTDHYEQIGNPTKITTPLSVLLGVPQLLALKNPIGYEVYYDTITGLSTADFLAIPGAEFGTKWQLTIGQNTYNHTSHTLALMGLARERNETLFGYCEQSGQQANLIRYMKDTGAGAGLVACATADGRMGRTSRVGIPIVRLPPNPRGTCSVAAEETSCKTKPSRQRGHTARELARHKLHARAPQGSPAPPALH